MSLVDSVVVRSLMIENETSIAIIQKTTLDTTNPNPYQPPGERSIAAQRIRTTRWMIKAGVVALLLSVLCLTITAIGMTWSFKVSETSSNPSDLAKGILYILIPSVAAVPLALGGIGLLILGFLRRRPVAEI